MVSQESASVAEKGLGHDLNLQLSQSTTAVEIVEPSKSLQTVESAQDSTTVNSITSTKMDSSISGNQNMHKSQQQQGSLQLLDLPMDVLKEIIKEVTHTNDLTSLALTHSALHNLAIPYIYSRFDIVWPDTQVNTDPRTGVDALTYGLSTLVMSHDVFAEAMSVPQKEQNCIYCCHCGKLNAQGKEVKDTRIIKTRKGNNYARYTRKFSLGNGPAEWVQEYLISKESGKMLGTLVALAVARMENLETFVWDMPTGIIRDVWAALSTSQNLRPGQKHRLEKIWIRWHDNKVIPASLNPPPVGPPPVLPSLNGPGPLASQMIPNSPSSLHLPREAYPDSLLARSYQRIEYPNFSLLPPLRSITVLDIDEAAYLDELSILVERSVDHLRELRIGAAAIWIPKSWTSPSQDDRLPISIDTSMSYATSGGMMGMIMSKLYDCRIPKQSLSKAFTDNQNYGIEEDSESKVDALFVESVKRVQSSLNILGADTTPSVADPALVPSLLDASTEDFASTSVPPLQPLSSFLPHRPANPSLTDSPETHLGASETAHEASIDRMNGRTINSDAATLGADCVSVAGCDLSLSNDVDTEVLPPPSPSAKRFPDRVSTGTSSVGRPVSRQRKLRLEVLELEKVPISVLVLQRTVDWTVLTSLTLLNCESDEGLWKMLRRSYAPRTNGAYGSFSTPTVSRTTPRTTSRKNSMIETTIMPADYALRLKKLHTNSVSPALIAFLKETLAPNTLEWMFLQDREDSPSKVTIDAIYRGPIRRHRASLRKVLIDSGNKRPDGSSSRSQKWKKWILNREVLAFVTSGKMTSLRELSMAVDYKDWHFFLQRLPEVPHIRSLYVPHIADHVHAHHLDAKEIALQVVDIATLRPEVELCYMGILTKCFEILEAKHLDDSSSLQDSSSSNGNAPTGAAMVSSDDESDADEDDNDEDDDDDDEDQAAVANPVADDSNDSDGADDSEGLSEDEGAAAGNGKQRPRLKLREILFYDDKVSIFKARHGQL